MVKAGDRGLDRPPGCGGERSDGVRIRLVGAVMVTVRVFVMAVLMVAVMAAFPARTVIFLVFVPAPRAAEAEPAAERAEAHLVAAFATSALPVPRTIPRAEAGRAVHPVARVEVHYPFAQLVFVALDLDAESVVGFDDAELLYDFLHLVTPVYPLRFVC